MYMSCSRNPSWQVLCKSTRQGGHCRWMALDPDGSLKAAFMSLNAPLGFPVVVILTQSLFPQLLPHWFSSATQSEQCCWCWAQWKHSAQSIFATLWLASSGRRFLLPAGDRLVYPTALCRGCSSQELKIFLALFRPPFFLSSRDPPGASQGTYCMQL